jgi:hypothetical protein
MFFVFGRFTGYRSCLNSRSRGFGWRLPIQSTLYKALHSINFYMPNGDVPIRFTVVVVQTVCIINTVGYSALSVFIRSCQPCSNCLNARCIRQNNQKRKTNSRHQKYFWSESVVPVRSGLHRKVTIAKCVCTCVICSQSHLLNLYVFTDSI